jgi:hypothetical protein
MDLQQGSFLQGRFTKTISDAEIRSFPHKHIFDLLNTFSKGNTSVQINGTHIHESSIPLYFVKEEQSLFNPMCPNQSLRKLVNMEPKSYAEVTKGYGHGLHNDKIIKSLVSPIHALFQRFCPKKEFNSFYKEEVSPVDNCDKSSYSCKVTSKPTRDVVGEPKEESFSKKSFTNYKKMVPQCPKTLSEKESMRGKSSHRNWRKSKSMPHNKQSLKREMGTKKQYPGKDLDGSVWARENSKYFVCDDKKPEVFPTTAVNCRNDEKTSSILPSSESDCLEFICAPLPLKARTVSECSIDSDDSFIVFESNDNTDDIEPEENSSDEDCSSDDNDEVLLNVNFSFYLLLILSFEVIEIRNSLGYLRKTA